MKVCVQGLWHLGSVTAACLAARGHDVAGHDEDGAVIEALNAGRAPVLEPGLDALIAEQLAAGRLRFTPDGDEAVRSADALWVAYDTPVDDDDVADTAFVLERVQRMLPRLSRGCLVIVSSQLPVGSVAALEAFARTTLAASELVFAAVPENLRLGKALEVFTQPDRIVAGVRDANARARLSPLLESISPAVEWMGVESAEMTKHAINAFLALSVTFVNELATVCEAVGADAKEVERGLKTETRIGKRAYLAPGGAFAGGTLARDVAFLGTIAARHGRRLPLIDAVRPSNELHKGWVARKLAELLTDVAGTRIAIWGLTYKPGTDTLRRSAAIELCRALLAQGARLVVHDPAVKTLPADLAARMEHATSPLEAVRGARALAICTEWPEYRSITAAALRDAAPGLVVVDPNRFLDHLAGQPGLRYHAVGTPGAPGAAHG